MSFLASKLFKKLSGKKNVLYICDFLYKYTLNLSWQNPGRAKNHNYFEWWELAKW